MAKADDKSITSDKVSTEKAAIAERDEEIAEFFAELFKPKSRKTRSTDDPQVKEVRRQSLRTAVEKYKAARGPGRNPKVAPGRKARQRPRQRGERQPSMPLNSSMPLIVSLRLGCVQESGCSGPLAEVNAFENISEGSLYYSTLSATRSIRYRRSFQNS